MALGVSSGILLCALLALSVFSSRKHEPSAPETPTSANPDASVGDEERKKFLEFQAKAEQGEAIAQYKLGRCYLKGEGVAKDEVEAAKWYRKAADRGHIFAQYHLGVCYGQGQGVAKDEVEAMKWYHMAGDKGDVFAQYELGHCYAEGLGVTKDEVEAYKWYLLAAARGKSEAKDGAIKVKGMMSAVQIAEGEQRAEQWRAQRMAKSENGGK